MTLKHSKVPNHVAAVLIGMACTTAGISVGHAATDGYGTVVVDETLTGSSYECAGAWLAPQEIFCDDNPFVQARLQSQFNDTYLDPLGGKTGAEFDDYFVGQTDSNWTRTAQAGQVKMYEGSIVSPSYTIQSTGADSHSALFKNHATGVTVSALAGGVVHLHSNNANGATLRNDVDSSIYLEKNSAQNAELENFGTMVLKGNNAQGAKITSRPGSSRLDIIHSSASEAELLVMSGSTINLYGSSANEGLITIESGGTLTVQDCSVAIGCEGATPSRGTSLSDGAIVTNDGVLEVSGDIALVDSTITNSATGVMKMKSGRIAGGAIINNGIIDSVDGAIYLDSDVSGTGQFQTEPDADIVLGSNVAFRTGAFAANGGSLRLNADLSAQTANSITAQEVTIAAGDPVTLLVDALPNTGSATNGNGILLVSVTGGATASAADAFRMTPFTNNGLSYSLKQAGDGNWYLQSVQAAAPTPTPVPTLHGSLLLMMSLALAAFGVRRLRLRA